MTIAYIGLGSNVGNREEFILRAVEALGLFSRVLARSSLIETKPVGNVNQPDFINAVVEIETDLSADCLFRELKEVESRLGRTPSEKWGPREIDLDLLAYGNVVCNDERLTIPHPRMHERRFVLEPLEELNPTWIHPKLNLSVKDLLKRIS